MKGLKGKMKSFLLLLIPMACFCSGHVVEGFQLLQKSLNRREAFGAASGIFTTALSLPKIAKAEEEAIAGNSANPTTTTTSQEFQAYSIVPDASEAFNPELLSLEVCQEEKKRIERKFMKSLFENVLSTCVRSVT